MRRIFERFPLFFVRAVPLAICLLAGLGSFPDAGIAGEDAIRDAAQRYLRNGDPDALATVERAGPAALPVLKQIASKGRSFPDAPKGRLSCKTTSRLKKTFPVEYTLWVPPDYDPAIPRPLLLYMHGTFGTGGGGMDLILRGFRETGWILLAPSSEIEGRGWTFTRFERSMQLDALAHVRRRYNVDPERIVAGGYSRGGHGAWDLALRVPDLFAAVFPMAGGPRLNNIRFAPNLAHTRIRIEYGARDEKGLVWCNRKAAAVLERFGIQSTVIEHAERGHQFSIDFEGIRKWLDPLRKATCPRRVVCTASQIEEARSFWIRLDKIHARKAELPAARKGKLVLGGEEVEIILRGLPLPPSFQKKPDEERWEVYVEKTFPYVASVVAEVKDENRVDVKAVNVRTFTILVTEALFDLAKPITVFVNGRRILSKTIIPSPTVLLRHLARAADWKTLYVNEIRVPVR
ncbi:MAG: carboxylesterase family protein [Planctomycetota bacterium]|jgi:dienelactone hydrolase